MAALLAAIFFIRTLSLVTHVPVVGLANNYDMIRVQGCVDLYPVREDGSPPESNSWQAPIERYEFRSDVQPGCFFSTESLLALASLPALKAVAMFLAEGVVPLQAIGLLRWALFVSIVMIPLLLLLRGNPKSACVGLLVAAIVVADPGVTIYLNSLYAEYSAVAFAWLACLMTWAALRSSKPSTVVLVILFAASVLATLSKLQHLAFGLALFASALIAAVSFERGARPWRVLAVLGLAAALGFFTQAWNINRDYTNSISSANKTNTFLGAILGSSEDPESTADLLGLPRSCAVHAGKDWFSPDVQSSHPCPEILSASRARLIPLTWKDPNTLINVISKGAELTRPWVPHILGKVSGQVQAPLPTGILSLDPLISAVPVPVWKGLLLLALAVAVFLALPGTVRGLGVAERWLLIFLGGFPFMTLVTVVLGDGFADVNKQFHLGMVALLAFYIVSTCFVLQAGIGRRVASGGSALQSTSADQAQSNSGSSSIT